MTELFLTKDAVWSHPPDEDSSETKLTDHLEKVGSSCYNYAPENHSEWEDIDFKEFVQDIGYLHDIGKLTQEFQRYIHPDSTQEKSNKYKHHSRFGAIVTAIAIHKKYQNTGLAYAAYAIVLEHHNAINRDIDRELDVFTGNGNTNVRDTIRWQLQDISEHTEDIANNILQNVFPELTWKKITEVLEDDFFNMIQELGGLRQGNGKEKMYYTVLSGWSTLILSDKLDAAGIQGEYNINQSMSYNQLDSHITGLQSNEMSRLNELRETARTNVLENRSKIDTNENNIYNITLETGFGKTYTGLSTALKMIDEGPDDRNIVYALPFTSIIDQVDQEIQSIFGVNPKSPEYTVHHHLSETISNPEDESKTSSFERRTQAMLAKTWSSDITLTTFVQLFESLVGPKNSQGLKIPALKNSIIILDEPQALSYEWWELIPQLCRYLIETYDVTIISMTATQPTLFKKSDEIDEIVELVSERQVFRTYLSDNPRVEYYIHKNAYDFINNRNTDSVMEYTTLSDLLVNNEKSSKMAICNTINSAERLTNEVIKTVEYTNKPYTIINEELDTSNFQVRESDQLFIAHLTTHISPRKREELLSKIDEILETNNELIVVSTQLIEAGVDISFETIYRDFAPLTSIVQAAGRCNRNGELDMGTVHIIRLDDPEDREETYIPSDIVYNQGVTLISATSNVLRHNGSNISEVDLHSYLDIFYKSIEKDAGENEPLKDIKEYNVDKLAEYKLITQRESLDVLLVRTNEEKRMVKQFETTHNPKEKAELYRDLEYLKISITNPSDELINAVSSECRLLDDIDTYVLTKEDEIYDSIFGIDEEKHSVENQFI